MKQQFLDCVKAIQEKGVLDIQRAKMELAIVVSDNSLAGELVTALKEEALATIQPSQHKERVQFFIDPSKYRVVDSIAKKIGANLEIVRQTVTREGDVDVALELERNTALQQNQNSHDLVKFDDDLAAEVAELDMELESMNLNSRNPYLNDSDDDDYTGGQVSQRQKNKKAQKKSKKAKRREKEDAAMRQEMIDAEKKRREEREQRLAKDNNDDNPSPAQAVHVSAGNGSKKSCNTCGGSFTPAEYRAHFRSDWHRYNQKLKMKGLQPIDEIEFKMFDEDAFFT